MKGTLTFLILFFFVFLGSLGTAFADVIIITYPGVEETTLSKKDIKEIFLGSRVQWRDRSKIRPVLLNEEEVLKEFLKIYVKKTEDQFLNHWKRMVFTGKGKSPKRFKSPAELIAYVSKTNGAIGCVESVTSVDNVNTIKVK